MYNSVRICAFNNMENRFCDLVLDPDVFQLMAHSRNPEELTHIWREWHDKTGPSMKNKFMRYIQLANQAARLNGKYKSFHLNRFIFIYTIRICGCW